ncbi:hypothetical protein M5K25_004427 [Dendrobium thyrsiflorum]|uniref:DUF4283 domain-containing protein n=1 Tax=Dendrobium thyrsiflorum TaxID=117978 RepID=A0ABD0VU62_DENTH
MKLTKWSPSLDVSVESPVIPIWVAFPLLRPHLYTHRILHGLGALFGKPVKIDAATSAGSRPSMSRVLVELDITKSYHKQVWLGSESLGYVQDVILDEFPPFCASCKCIGHVAGNCRPPHSSKLPITVAKPAIKLSLPIPSSMPTVEPVEAPNLMVNAEQASGLDEDNLEESLVAAPVSVPDLTTNVVGFGDAELAVISTPSDPISIPDDPGFIAVTILGDSPIGVCEAVLGVMDIPISVVSNEEFKSHVAWSLNNSVLLQTNWLEMDESDLTPSVGKCDDLTVHVNDDMYNFMVGCVMDQAVLYGGGKRKKSKSKKK